MKREKRRPVDTGESLPYIEAADAAGALSKQTALRETTVKPQWRIAESTVYFEKDERRTSGNNKTGYQ